MYLYSPTTKGFYVQEIHGNKIPLDVVQVTKERHEELMQGQSEGLEITEDENGLPVLKTPQPEGSVGTV